MPLTAADRARRYREKKKNNPKAYEKYLQDERDRYYRRKERGDFKISNNSERAQTHIRRKWRIKQRERRERKRLENKGMKFLLDNSPATTPTRREPQNDERAENPEVPVNHENQNEGRNHHQVATGKRRKKRNKARAYRTIDQLEKERDHFRTLWENSRKSCQRLRKKYEARRTKKSHRKIQKKSTPMKQKKRVLLPIKLNQIVKKIYKKTGHSVSWNIDMRKRVKHFLEEDINSTQAPGKKDTITREKVKKQKRYLNDTLLNLYQTFIERHPEIKVSYVSFCRFRPFWIVSKRVDARETCLCKLHENVKLRTEKLYRLNVIDENNPNKLIEQLVCKKDSYECAYGKCSNCTEKKIKTAADFTEELGATRVSYSQWVNRAEVVQTKDGVKSLQKTLKVEENETVDTLLEETNRTLKERYVKHIYNIRHQYIELTKIKENLKDTEAVIHVDFSENYNGKLAREIQSMHFGGNRCQIALHTVVVYLKTNVQSYCTVSDNTQHGPGAIWAHLQPVLQTIKENNPGISAVHFVSDGPSTQYRSKNNFYLFHNQALDNYGFEQATWNFTESGHGKSAADGVGGAVKRTADRLVANGKDINDALSLYETVGPEMKNVRMFMIADEDIQELTRSIPVSLKTVKGTMKIHQVVINSGHRGILKVKLLSCFCKWPNACSCYAGEAGEHGLGAGEISGLTNEPDALPTGREKAEADTLPSNQREPETEADGSPYKVGSWCAVLYQGEIYPGIIQDLDAESVEVKCMARAGVNRYFWPQMEDIIWYKWDDVMMPIEEPSPLTGRHCQIESEIYNMIKENVV